MLQKNTGSQTWEVFAFDPTDGTPVTGDAANITAEIAIDGGSLSSTNDTNPTEIKLGRYRFDLTQAETNGDVLDLYPQSSTSNVEVIGIPVRVFTVAPNHNAKAVDDIADSNNRVKADVERWLAGTPAGLQDTDKVPASAQHMADGLITAAKIATDAIAAAKIANNAITGDKLADSATAKIEAALLNEGDGQQLIDAIVQAIDDADISTNLTVALIRDGILNRVLPGNHDTSDTVGAFLQELDAAISTRSSHSAADAADATWDEPQGDHTTADTFGARVQTTKTNTDTLLTRIPSALFNGITSLAEWLGLIAGKQTGNSTARTELRGTGAGSGTYDETTDSLEAQQEELAKVPRKGAGTFRHRQTASDSGNSSADVVVEDAS